MNIVKLKKNIKSDRKRPLIGLALGGGSARGLAHIGVLKVLHKHKIYPDYISGTSMGAVIGAIYAAGHFPEEIENLVKSTDWKKFIDITIPKEGLIKGAAAERKIRKIVNNKKFKELNTKLSVVSYNLDKKEEVIFDNGDVARAVHASMSIPGIFAPTKINGDYYIDGAVVNPTPFDVVRKMGADIVIAVDLYNKQKIIEGPKVKESNLVTELKEYFLMKELLNIKNYLFPKRWPKFLRKILIWMFDKLLYPAKILRIAAKRELPTITKIMSETTSILINSLAVERFEKGNIDIRVMPKYGNNLRWSDFNKSESFVKAGEKAMKNKIQMLKRKIKNY